MAVMSVERNLIIKSANTVHLVLQTDTSSDPNKSLEIHLTEVWTLFVLLLFDVFAGD